MLKKVFMLLVKNSGQLPKFLPKVRNTTGFADQLYNFHYQSYTGS